MTNYHCHSHYCDGTQELETYVVEAIARKMNAIGFTSHSPVPFSSTWNMPVNKLADYTQEIDRLKLQYKNQIVVLKSLEIDYIQQQLGPDTDWIKNLKLDYTIGSVHYTQPMIDGTWWSIDDHLGVFLEGLQQVYDNDIQKLVTHYFDLQCKMVENETPDIIGHFDKIKMHNRLKPVFDENSNWYRDCIRQLMELISSKNCIVEINTKSFDGNGLLFPGEEHFDWLKELNIPVTVNSDSHHPNHLTSGFEHVAGLLKKHHIEEVVIWQPNGWSMQGIDKWLM